ncbi:TRAP transporter small permease [Psychrosphaera algicola]|uniref:TRAP transporter small permease protein n=1 Tax=Psychrosphaera algicola TaxID=3023714 RepID=A0ABT5FIR6_9GAMM|nr:TRAP transporter small permease [Psychrosphaera sp. G1-22]MDC2891093.1 TRAP transporter small permease [Psychrosphaera sp. G1-22]
MSDKLVQFEQRLAASLLVAIVLLVFSAAVMRSFGAPIIWSVDFAQLFFAWLSMLGADQALRNFEHVGVDLFVRHLSWQHRVKLDLVLYSLMFIGLVILLIFGLKLVLLNPQRELGTTGLSYSLVTLALPVGALLMLNTVQQQWRALFRLRHGILANIHSDGVKLPSYLLSELEDEQKANLGQMGVNK